jgi:hypothetical protein
MQITVKMLFAMSCACAIVAINAIPPAAARGAENLQAVMDQCARQYCGDRGRLGPQIIARGVEACFRDKTGQRPTQAGVRMTRVPVCQ